MKLVPIVYVSDMQASVDFYTALGATIGATGVNAYWTELMLNETTFALHIHDSFDDVAVQRVGLSLAADEPLEAVAQQLATRGIQADRGIADEAFGRSMVVRDPDGLAIQINEHDSSL